MFEIIGVGVGVYLGMDVYQSVGVFLRKYGDYFYDNRFNWFMSIIYCIFLSFFVFLLIGRICLNMLFLYLISVSNLIVNFFYVFLDIFIFCIFL